MTNQEVGAWGEELAAAFLLRQGFIIVERNWRTRWGEIDVVAARGQELHFVEVKTRVVPNYGAPEEAIHYHKLRHLMGAAKAYVADRQPSQKEYQIDSIGIFINLFTRKAKIRYLSNIAQDGYSS